jgi:hypothetical protein
MVWSADAEAMHVPSGWNAVEYLRSRLPSSKPARGANEGGAAAVHRGHMVVERVHATPLVQAPKPHLIEATGPGLPAARAHARSGAAQRCASGGERERDRLVIATRNNQVAACRESADAQSIASTAARHPLHGEEPVRWRAGDGAQGQPWEGAVYFAVRTQLEWPVSVYRKRWPTTLRT